MNTHINCSPEPSRAFNYNRILHCLTNRSGNFQSTCFPSNANFFPKKQKKDWEVMQRLLMLDSKSTDYYIKLAISVLEGYPDIKKKIVSHMETYDVARDFAMESTTLEDASFKHAEISYFKSTPYNYEFPIPEKYTVYPYGDLIRIDTSTNLSFVQKVDVVHQGKTGSLLTFDWTEVLPFKGTLLYTRGNWDKDTCRIGINYVPFRVDIGAWIKDIESKVNLENFLGGSALFTLYSLASSSYEKLAYLYYALVEQHEGWENEL